MIVIEFTVFVLWCEYEYCQLNGLNICLIYDLLERLVVFLIRTERCLTCCK